MDAEQDAPITELLARARDGDSSAFDQVYSAVYEELRRLARARRRKQGQLGLLPPEVDLTGYHRFADGTVLVAIDITATVGTVTVDPRDVARITGASVTLEERVRSGERHLPLEPGFEQRELLLRG